MVYVYARHTVEDPESWKATLSADRASREALGAQDIETFRVYNSEDDVAVLMELEEEDVAEAIEEDLPAAFGDVTEDNGQDGPEIVVFEKVPLES